MMLRCYGSDHKIGMLMEDWFSDNKQHKTTILDKKCQEFCSFLLTGDPPCGFGAMVTPPWSMLFSRQQKCSGHTSTLFFWGGRGSILSEPGFRGKYSLIKHTTGIFLNIFVQDCILEILNGMRHSKHVK